MLDGLERTDGYPEGMAFGHVLDPDLERSRAFYGETLGLPEIPVFQLTPPPEANVLTFPAPIKSTRPASVRRRS